MKQLPEPHRHL